VHPLGDVIGDDAVEADRRHEQREPPKATNIVAPICQERRSPVMISRIGKTLT
jgi:hypothetical protein